MFQCSDAVMIYEKMKCQVRIDNYVANVMMVSSVDGNKVHNIEMRIDEFLVYENISRNNIP